MKIFKYIFKIAFTNTLLSILVILGIVWVSQSFRSIKFILEKGGNFFDFMKLSFLSMPAWLSISISFGVFFGILMSFSKLDDERELIVMKSSGLKASQLALPGIILSLIFSIVLFLNLHLLLPLSYSSFKKYEDHIRYRAPQNVFNEAIFFDIDKNRTIYFQNKNNKKLISGLFIQDRNDKENIVEIFAEEGSFFSKNKQIFLVLKNGTKIISNKGNTPTIIDFDLDTIPFKNLISSKSNNKVTRVIEFNELTFFQLVEKSSLDKKTEGKYLSEAHSRNINAILPLVFALIVLSLILLSHSSRTSNVSKKIIIFSFVILTQSIVIITKNAVTNNTYFLPLLYFVPITLIITCLFCLKYESFIYLILNRIKLKNA